MIEKSTCRETSAFYIFCIQITAKPCISSILQKLYITKAKALYIIKPQRRYTLSRDEIQPKGLMIYAFGDDIPSLRLG